MNAQSLPVRYEDIAAAALRIAGQAHRTPVLTSDSVNARTGALVFFKCENLQRVGAFKARGALNTLLWMKEQGMLPRRAVAYSSGNHAQAVAWAARELGIKAEIYMPEASSAVKRAATEAYGARVHLRAREGDEQQASKRAPSCYHRISSGRVASTVTDPLSG